MIKIKQEAIVSFIHSLDQRKIVIQQRLEFANMLIQLPPQLDDVRESFKIIPTTSYICFGGCWADNRNSGSNLTYSGVRGYTYTDDTGMLGICKCLK
jgi:hypothetical protein